MRGNKVREIKQHTFEKKNRLAYLVLVDNIIERLEGDVISEWVTLKIF
jgi:hypothetical protein